MVKPWSCAAITMRPQYFWGMRPSVPLTAPLAVQRLIVEGWMDKARARLRQPPNKSTTRRAGCMTCLEWAMCEISDVQNNVNLTTLDCMLVRAQHDGMPEINQEWFKERLRQVKLSQRQLAKKMDLDPASVSYMLSGKRAMSMEEARQLAGHLLLPVTEVMRQAGIDVQDDVRKVPVAGYISAGGVVSLLPKGTHDTVSCPADVPTGSFAVQARIVNSANDGWLWFVSGIQEEPEQCGGKLALLALKDGRMLCAIIKRGYKSGHYNLILMPEGGVLENKEVAWCARILWIQPT